MSNVFVFRGLSLKCSPLHELPTSALLLIHSVKGERLLPLPLSPHIPLVDRRADDDSHLSPS